LRPARHVAAAIIRRGDEVVLVLQGARGAEPFWALPGGIVENDELVPEGLVREVLEETGLRIEVPARLAYLLQIDNRAPVELVGGKPGPGYLVTVWVFEIESWSGELGAQDPDGFVKEAALVPVAEAVVRLRGTHWLELAAEYLEGKVARGSLHFERWNVDGSVDQAQA
jgi:ADP-ribose pyrophosphatase YjhB (NUDIX family)